MKTKELKCFRDRDEAGKYAREVNDLLQRMGESLDKFAYKEYRKTEKNGYQVWAVMMITEQELPTSGE